MSTREIVKMAMYLALFLVLDFVSNQIPIFEMPSGGSLGVGVIPLLLASYDLGFKKGSLVALLSIPLMFMTGPVWFVSFGQFALDYILSFGVYGLAVLFPTFREQSIYPLMSGIVITNALRTFFSYLSGVWYYEVPPLASLTYQLSYMVPTLILTIIVVPLISARLKRDS